MKHKQFSIFFAFGFLMVIALFVIVRNVGEQQKITVTHASASSTFIVTNTASGVNVGGTQTIDVTVNPGNNAVSLINLTIDYDNSKLNPLANGFAPNTTAFSAVLDGPVYNTCSGTQCTMYIAISVGSNPTSAITTTTKVATLNFQALSGGATQVSIDSKSEIYSVAAQDQANENVMSSTGAPLSITIGGTGIVTPIPLPSGTIVPTPTTDTTTSTTPVPTSTPSITPTPTSVNTTINLQLQLPGIGIGGGNAHPLHPLRPITFYLYNIDTNTLITKENSVVFDGSYFVRPVISLGDIPDGTYQVFIHSPQYLTTRLAQTTSTNSIQIKNGQTIQVTPNALIAGDIAPIHSSTYGDNVLDIIDYNALLSCYGRNASRSSCMNKQAADLDDNGIIDAIDYNIMLRGFNQTHTGDTIPGNPNL